MENEYEEIIEKQLKRRSKNENNIDIGIFRLFFSYNNDRSNTRMEGMSMINKKLLELILYIAEKSKRDPSFGVIKLNKTLFIADFRRYGQVGKSITGADYIHFPLGPAPNGIPEIQEELVTKDRAEIKEVLYFDYTQKRIIAKDKPDLSLFDKEELELIDQVIRENRNLNGTELSEWSHSLVPWIITRYGEKIPYQTIFLMKKLPVEMDGFIWAEQQLDRIKRERKSDCL